MLKRLAEFGLSHIDRDRQLFRQMYFDCRTRSDFLLRKGRLAERITLADNQADIALFCKSL